MVARKPLVHVSGDVAELPAADILAPGATLTTAQRDALVTPATGQRIYNSTTSQPEYYDGTLWRNYAGDPSIGIGQLVGSASVAEVEATKALRVSMRPFEVDDRCDAFNLNQYALGTDPAVTQSLTTSALTDAGFLVGGWFSAGYAILRQLRVTLWTQALSGTRNGTCNVKLWKASSLTGVSNAGLLLVPDAATSPAAGTNRYTNGLIGRQLPPQLNLGYSTAIAFGNGINVPELEQMGVVYGECKNAIGTHIQNQILFDARAAELPFYMSRYQGFFVVASVPAAVTSQTIGITFNMRWDEFIPARFAD